MRKRLLEAEPVGGGLYDAAGMRAWLEDPSTVRRDWRALVTLYTVGLWWRQHFG
jgi:hypothetical protein